MLQFLVIPLFATGVARADFVCHDFAHLPFAAQDCDDNEQMGEQALACVRSYRAHVQKAQAAVLRKFEEQVKAQREQQSDSFDRTQAGYENARKQLEALINDGHTARAAVDDLLANINFPEDYDEPEVTGMKTETYLAKSKCYAIPRRVMQQSQFMIDKMVGDLEATKATISSMRNGAGSRSAKVQLLDQSKVITGTSHEARPKTKGGRSGGSQSDITGVPPKDQPPK